VARPPSTTPIVVGVGVGNSHKQHRHFCQIKSRPTLPSPLKQQHICLPNEKTAGTEVRKRLLTPLNKPQLLGELRCCKATHCTKRRGEIQLAVRAAGLSERVRVVQPVRYKSVRPSVLQRLIKTTSQAAYSNSANGKSVLSARPMAD
jgi:hypothetical protein